MEHNEVVVEHRDVVELVKDLWRQAKALEPDLAERAGEPDVNARLRAEHSRAYDAKRTAMGYTEWLEGRVAQAAAAWVLATLFIRYCEDNGLIEWPYLAGPKERLLDAEGRHTAFFRDNPGLNDRDWLIAAIEHLAGTNDTVAGLFDHRHNPLWDITPSYEGAASLVTFWRRQAPDEGSHWQFTGWDTRFLGDVYEELSEYARKAYALRQTPEFVEEFILDLTLQAAFDEFPLLDLRTIDPTCGSGHFVLGLFRRILDQWRDARQGEQGADEWELIRRSLDSVHGVDKNPFAVSIARFRLLVAVLEETGIQRLDQAPAFPINLAVGDSLIHGRGAPRLRTDQEVLFDLGDGEEPMEHTYTTEDVNEFSNVNLLGRGSYHVVVGNPPYITVKDKRENESYRGRYDACAGQYHLSGPFTERFFKLAVRTGGDDRRAGFVGLIIDNAFMKREFGKKLIEQFFPTVHLTHIIDTSGAYIPGHGTPTVILAGRNHLARSEKVRAVLGVRGEPGQPEVPEHGLVWQAIVAQVRGEPSESPWVSAGDVARDRFLSHPWSLSGGGANDLFESISGPAERLLGKCVAAIGRTTHTGADESYFAPLGSWNRSGVDPMHVVPLVGGEVVRDWTLAAQIEALFPYDSRFKADLSNPPLQRLLWKRQALLRMRRELGGTHEEIGLTWYEWSRWHPERFAVPLGISFPFVATHNHFVLDRGGKVFKQTAPVIKLPEGASEDDHLALLGVLNSSTGCFWLKQVSQSKGNGGIGGGISDELWEHRFEFTGTKLQDFPLPARLPLELGRELDQLAQQVARNDPSAVCGTGAPSRAHLDDARRTQDSIRRRMIALQEELDWQVYGSYGLLTDAEVAGTTVSEDGAVPEIWLGERAFEVVLARRVAAGEVETAWFERHGSTPATQLPSHWPATYRGVVQARIELIEKRRDLALIERPECKRRWSVEPWDKREREALEAWLLDRCEDRQLWFTQRDGFQQPRPLTVSQLADQFRSDEDVQSVAQLYGADHLGKRDWTLAQVLEAVIADEHVPYLAVLRYRDSGLTKRAEWERVWEQQREEDRTGQRLDIAVPSKYKPADFARPSYWTHRGKLDVPKERFISYPGASPDADPTLLLGWAGWDHKDQAQVLVNLVNDRGADAGWGADRLTPLLAGLREVLPWVRQWHGEYDSEWEGVPAEDIAGFLDAQQIRHGLSAGDLRAWTPVRAKRGRRPS